MMHVAFAIAAFAGESSDTALLREIVRAESTDVVDVVLNADHETQTIIGRYDLGLSSGFSDREASAQLRRFVDARADWFLPVAGGDLADWRLEAVEGDVDGLRVLRFTQWSDGVHWFDSEIVASFFESDGALHSISGELRQSIPLKGYVPGSSLGIDPATRKLVKEEIDSERRVLRRVGLDGRLLTERAIDDSTVTRNCSITSREWVTNGSGFVTDARSFSGLYTTSTRCEGDEIWFTSDCTFKLRAASAGRGLHQLVDGSDDGLGQNYEVTAPCSTASPTFSSTSANNAEQRNIFVWLSEAANVSNAYFFAAVPPEATDKVRPHTDYSIMSGPTARYQDQTREIFFNADGVSSTAIASWHEYGHHVANMYGNLNDECNPFVNEGDPIDECVGAMTGMVVMYGLKADGVEFSYGAARDMGLGGGANLSPHSTTSGPLVYSQGLCNNSIYIAAAPFAQAFWEVLGNRDCNLTNCSTGVYAFRDSTSSLTSVGENAHTVAIAKSLASALKLTPANTTFSSLLSFMNASWVTSFNATDAAELRAVFQHHGF